MKASFERVCGKFTAMASWAEVVAFSQPLTADRDYSKGNDKLVTLQVMGQVPVIIWDEATQSLKPVMMRWGFQHPKNWRIPQPIHARSETIDELRTFKGPFLAGKRGIVLMRTFNEGKQVTKSKTEQWTIDPIPAYMTGAAVIFDSFTVPDFPAPILACVLVTVPANALVRSLSTEFAESDRMPALIAEADWETWLGQGGNDPRPPRRRARLLKGCAG